MASILLNIQGDVGTVEVQAFTVALNSLVEVLRDLDQGVSHEPKGTLDWVITDLSMGSLQARIAPVSRVAEKNAGPEVISLAVGGLNRIEKEGASPAYLTMKGMSSAKKFLEVIGHHGAAGLTVSNGNEIAELTAKARVTIAELVKPRHRSIGSVEGVLEMISLHRKPHFTVYSTLTNRAITCNFVKEAFLHEVKEALGTRVNVSGVVHSNIKGEPLYVNVERIRRLRSSSELPSIFKIRGMDADYTGGVSSEEYVGAMRRRG